jgi:hypothetical protein
MVFPKENALPGTDPCQAVSKVHFSGTGQDVDEGVLFHDNGPAEPLLRVVGEHHPGIIDAAESFHRGKDKNILDFSVK